VTTQKMLGLLQAAAHLGEFSLQGLSFLGTVTVYLGAQGIKDGVSDATLESGHLVGQIAKGLH
jgi:hypothetical protein